MASSTARRVGGAAVFEALLSVALLTASVAGCERAGSGSGNGTAGEARPPSTASAAADAPPADDETACTAGAVRCESDAEASACADDGSRWVAQACAPSAACVGGRCVGLVHEGVVVPRKRLYGLGSEGWLNGWSRRAPLSKKDLDELVASPTALGASSTDARRSKWKPACAPEGFVEALAAGAPGPALLAGYLVADRAREVLFKLGPEGHVRLWVEGTLVADVARPGGERAFQDEIVVAASLREGMNRVVVAVEPQKRGRAGFWLRAAGPDGAPLHDLRFATAQAEADCAPADLVETEGPALVPIAGGFRIELSARILGLVPAGPGTGAGAEVTVALAAREGQAQMPLGGVFATAGASPQALSMLAAPLAPGLHHLELRVAGRDAPLRRVPLKFQGELHERIVALRAELPRLSHTGIPSGSRESLEHHVDTLVRALAEGDDEHPWLRDHLAAAEHIALELRAGRDPYEKLTGVVHRAYRSELSGALQPYVLFVPASYAASAEPFPLVMVAHGMHQRHEHALRALVGRAAGNDLRSARHLPSFPDQKALLAAPWGFGDAGPRPLGEHDTLRVIDEMKEHYRVDPRRVSLTGYSLGGTVAFVVPLHHPDRFAAAAPLCGYPDLSQWDTIRTLPKRPWEDVLVTRRSIANVAENGHALPMHIVHGKLDRPSRSAVVADRYRALGQPHTFETPDLGHNVWDHAYGGGKMVRWLSQQKRAAVPDRVRFSTGELRYDRADWVRLLAPVAGMEERADHSRDAQLAAIDARRLQAEGRIDVKTRNVAVFALALGDIAPRPRAITVDGQTLEAPPQGREAFLVREGDAWTVRDAEPDRRGFKRAGVAGPLDDAHRHPLLIVYGTRDAAQTESNRLVAEHFSSFDTWRAARFPVRSDAMVTEAELAGKSLVLVGNPRSNSLTARFESSLPVRFEAGAVVLRGVRHEGEAVGVSLIHPRPDEPGRYLVLHAGVTFRGTLESRHLPRLMADYLVYDERITTRRVENLLRDREVRAGGYFDERWR